MSQESDLPWNKVKNIAIVQLLNSMVDGPKRLGVVVMSRGVGYKPMLAEEIEL